MAETLSTGSEPTPFSSSPIDHAVPGGKTNDKEADTGTAKTTNQDTDHDSDMAESYISGSTTPGARASSPAPSSSSPPVASYSIKDRFASHPPPLTVSPLPPMSRKRTASINTDDAVDPRIEDLSLQTPSTASPHSFDGGRELICLCTPAPKVPRPRNAFILYRQHHQAQVVAQHPGLANPEISKIIGEQWREEPEEHKNQWKRLAEEEKQRHQRQYPDYRYQPRRGNKAGSGGVHGSRSASVSIGEDPGRCARCGGRYIATPRTPSTPFATPISARAPAHHMPQHGGGPGRGGSGGQLYASPNPHVIENDQFAQQGHRRQASHSRAGSGGIARAYAYAGGIFVPGPPDEASRAEHHRWNSPLPGISEDYDPRSPSDAKRRRFNAAGQFQSMSPMTYASSSPNGGGAHGHYQQSPYGRQRQLVLTNVNGSPVRKPSIPDPYSAQPTPMSGVTPAGPLPLGRHPSVSAPMGPPPPPRHRSISYMPQPPTPFNSGFDESLRLPPLQTQVPEEPQQLHQPQKGHPSQVQPQGLRESQARSIEAMVMSIPFMNKLRVLATISPSLQPPGPASPAVETRGPIVAVEGSDLRAMGLVTEVVRQALEAHADFAMRTWPGDESKRLDKVDASGNPFIKYLETMSAWHARSSEIVRFVTTHPPAAEAPSNAAEPASSEDHDSSASTSEASTPLPSAHAPSRPRVPVALLTGGFSLYISDRFASSVPISDAYAPVDHWQWMATLWRGIVGPDLVVYVQVMADEEIGASTVEFKTPSVLVVRVGRACGMGEQGERRLAFELVEWVRAGAYREGFGRN